MSQIRKDELGRTNDEGRRTNGGITPGFAFGYDPTGRSIFYMNSEIEQVGANFDIGYETIFYIKTTKFRIGVSTSLPLRI
jgi:hypothetical protein